MEANLPREVQAHLSPEMDLLIHMDVMSISEPVSLVLAGVGRPFRGPLRGVQYYPATPRHESGVNSDYMYYQKN